jgi:hypothetical protein
MKASRASLLCILGLSLLSLATAQTEYGCRLSNNNCNGNGLCELNGVCTCKPGYLGESCEIPSGKKFMNGSQGKGFITFWVLFWILLNLLLPLLICIIINYLKEKNCQLLKELKEMCCDSMCCCLSKVSPTEKTGGRFGGGSNMNNGFQGKSLLEDDAQGLQVKPESIDKDMQKQLDDEEAKNQKKPEIQKLENLVNTDNRLVKATEKMKKQIEAGDRSELPIRSIQAMIQNFMENHLPGDSSSSIVNAGAAQQQKPSHCKNLAVYIEDGNSLIGKFAVQKQTHAINHEIAKALDGLHHDGDWSSRQRTESKKELENQIQELEKKLEKAKFKPKSSVKQDILMSIR